MHHLIYSHENKYAQPEGVITQMTSRNKERNACIHKIFSHAKNTPSFKSQKFLREIITRCLLCVGWMKLAKVRTCTNYIVTN